ncbi:AAA family ATPase [Pseudarthrobacter sulfonivorans]|uniref:AAA family ATPase n=1 Tax=Pseudarthrobacter sulfonivorans TaxID=121292 RepID=UPI00278B2E3B|nr:AAA family ATPase [Pseudarthrobacter sulfonivorans]MDQ0000342.1 wobble nucleotide-excising tRNase [Pseudarthrobacter sulfonivorans]
MLESVHIMGAPCFAAEGVVVGPLGKCNFFYGANGAGKTTISRALADGSHFPGSTLSWSADAKSLRVYNREYVRSTFGAISPKLPAVFLLGTDSRDVHASLESLTDEIAALNTKNGHWKKTWRDKLNAIEAARDELKATAWAMRNDVPTELHEMFRGYKGSKENFLTRVLEVSQQVVSTTDTFDTLVGQASSVLDLTATKIDLLEPVSVPSIPASDGMELLAKPITGSTDVELADLIEFLDNGDWVHHGQKYLERSEGRCPFCQQETPKGLEQELNTYFDARYTAQLQYLANLGGRYRELVTKTTQYLGQLKEPLLQRVDAASMELAFEHLLAALERNLTTINEKIQQPSNIVVLENLGIHIDRVNKLVTIANSSILDHNNLVNNRALAKRELISRCWTFFVQDTLEVPLAKYSVATRPLVAASNGVLGKITEAEASLASMQDRLAALKNEVSSSESVITHINAVLHSVGFNSFKLTRSSEVEDGYILERSDGTPADVGSLSEGERTFITFLYFYHQLRDMRSGDAGSKLVAVIDDPISSLDSDIIFVVSSLIKKLMAEVDSSSGNVEQLLLLTHNAHFHNEVTYRKEGALNRYFSVKKRRVGPNEVLSHGSVNPVRTVYRSLWEEVAAAKAKPESASIGLQNIMRRILENYFRILGGIDDSEIVSNFQDEQQAVCRSLLSWANDGSHSSTFDTIDFSPTEVSIEIYLQVFEEIFTRSGNPGHYKMMMPAQDVQLVA